MSLSNAPAMHFASGGRIPLNGGWDSRPLPVNFPTDQLLTSLAILSGSLKALIGLQTNELNSYPYEKVTPYCFNVRAGY
jgi:hypothetical protein